MRRFPLTLCWSRARSFKSPSKQQRHRLRRHFQRVNSAASGWFSDLCREPVRDRPGKMLGRAVGSAGGLPIVRIGPAFQTRQTQPNQPGLSGDPEIVVDLKTWFIGGEQICDVVKRFIRRLFGFCLYLVRRENEL